jgi:hypothetical protein
MLTEAKRDGDICARRSKRGALSTPTRRAARPLPPEKKYATATCTYTQADTHCIATSQLSRRANLIARVESALSFETKTLRKSPKAKMPPRAKRKAPAGGASSSSRKRSFSGRQRQQQQEDVDSEAELIEFLREAAALAAQRSTAAAAPRLPTISPAALSFAVGSFVHQTGVSRAEAEEALVAAVQGAEEDVAPEVLAAASAAASPAAGAGGGGGGNDSDDPGLQLWLEAAAVWLAASHERRAEADELRQAMEATLREEAERAAKPLHERLDAQELVERYSGEGAGNGRAGEGGAGAAAAAGQQPQQRSLGSVVLRELSRAWLESGGGGGGGGGGGRGQGPQQDAALRLLLDPKTAPEWLRAALVGLLEDERRCVRVWYAGRGRLQRAARAHFEARASAWARELRGMLPAAGAAPAPASSSLPPPPSLPEAAAAWLASELTDARDELKRAVAAMPLVRQEQEQDEEEGQGEQRGGGGGGAGAGGSAVVRDMPPLPLLEPYLGDESSEVSGLVELGDDEEEEAGQEEEEEGKQEEKGERQQQREAAAAPRAAAAAPPPPPLPTTSPRDDATPVARSKGRKGGRAAALDTSNRKRSKAAAAGAEAPGAAAAAAAAAAGAAAAAACVVSLVDDSD